MVRGFTFFDPVFLGGSRESAVYVFLGSFAEPGLLDISFFGTHQSASEFTFVTGQDLTFYAGGHAEILISRDFAETSAQETAFQSGTHFFALLDYGTYGADPAGSDNGAGSATFQAGEHTLLLIISGSGTNPLGYDGAAGSSSFWNGLHAEILVPTAGSLVLDTVSGSTAFDSGAYSLSGTGDGKDGGYILRLLLTTGSNEGTILYAESGILVGHTFELNDVVYTITYSEGTTLLLDKPFEWDTGVYQVLTVAPTPTPLPPPPPGVVAYGSGSILSDTDSTLFLGASFESGTHFEVLISGADEADLAPSFITFYSGLHQFTLEFAGSSEPAFAEASFYDGTHAQILVITAGTSDPAAANTTFLSGNHYESFPTADNAYETADLTGSSLDRTTITVDQTVVTLDNALTADRDPS